MDDRIKIIPLAGLEEVGRNMTVFEYDGKIIIVDAGLAFPGPETPGIDYIIPNISYLKNKSKDILGILVTHGHYDHIGAIPYIQKPLGNPTIYTARLTAGMIRKRQEDFPAAPPLRIQEVRRDETFVLGPFRITTFPVNHNIPDGMGFVIETKIGSIVHTGDFKIDYTPIGENPADLGRIATLCASKKILLLMSDSTNASEGGHSMSEAQIQDNLESLFQKIPGRIIVGTFSSLLSRVQELFNLAEKFDRKVAIDGYSMKENVRIALELGYLKIKPKTLVSVKELNKLPPEKVLLVCTGSQGEDGAVLMRLAHKEHQSFKIHKGDTLILSSSVIPGNEKGVQELKDEFSWQGADIINYQMIDIHASGHGNQEELKTMINLVHPQLFMPIHGSRYMLEQHRKLALAMGIPEKDTYVGSNGKAIEISDRGIIVLKENIPSEKVFVDGLGIGDVGDIVLRDRSEMSRDGIVMLVMVVSGSTGRVVHSPDIVSRGFVYLRESQELLKEIRKRSTEITERIATNPGPTNWIYLKDQLREDIAEFLFKKTQRRPIIIPVVISV